MAGTSGIGFGVRMVAGAGLAACVALGAYFTYQTFMVGEDAPTPMPTAMPQTVTAVETTTSPEASADPTPEATAEATPDPAMDTASDPVDAPVIAPSFDVVRIEPDGSSVIAGNAAPNAVVTILLGAAEIGQATADSQGKFVALLNVPSQTEAQVLSLSVQQADDVLVVSNDSVILAPLVQAEQQPQPSDAAQVVPESATEPSTTEPSTTELSTTEQATTEQATVEAPETNPTVTPAAPAVLLANEQGVRVIQPAARSPSVMANVVIDAISYDAQGEVQLSGRAADQAGEAGFVRVYLNDAAIQTTRIERSGDWRTALPNVDTGIYVLRVDQVDASGAVTSRTQTPFKRETAEVLAETQDSDATQPVRAITVQPGSTLWAIAREKYGDGTLYVRVFEANSDSIRNPDLIYPGQVFQVPE